MKREFRGFYMLDNLIGNAGVTYWKNVIVEQTRFKMTSIVFALNDIDDGGALAVAEAILCCPNLQYLGLDFNRIGDVGAAAIADRLAQGSCPRYVLIMGLLTLAEKAALRMHHSSTALA